MSALLRRPGWRGCSWTHGLCLRVGSLEGCKGALTSPLSRKQWGAGADTKLDLSKGEAEGCVPSQTWASF